MYSAEQKKIDYNTVFGSEAGKRVLADILDSAGVWRSIFDTDNSQMCFNEGQRNMGLYIMGTMELDLETLRDITNAMEIEEDEPL